VNARNWPTIRLLIWNHLWQVKQWRFYCQPEPS